MIKKIFTFILIAACPAIVLSQTDTKLNSKEPAKGKTCYIFEEKIKIRDNKNTDANVIGLGSIGEQVTVLEKTDKLEEIYQYSAFWYKVKWKDKTGFVWGGLLASSGAEADFNNDGKKEILMYRIIGDFINLYKMKYEFRLCIPGTLLSTALHPELTQIFELGFNKMIIHDDKGNFSPSVTLVELESTYGEGAGYSNTHDFYFIEHGEFVPAFKYTNSVYLNDSEKTSLTFNGNNIVTLQTETIKYKYDEKIDARLPDKMDSKTVTEQKLSWNGSGFKKL